MVACFIGHRTVNKSKELILSLKDTVVSLISKGVNTFLFGSMSEFNDISLQVVTDIRKKYPYIKRVYVRSAFQHIDKFYENYLLNFYEDTYFPPKVKNAGKYSYVERNYEMIDKSTFCIFYYNENYISPLKRQSKHKISLQSRRNSGTKLAYNYAVKMNKVIINLFQ